ncbi:hypothetical protein GCM10010193_51550 [Kitasatospora atroaurantiaca]|uniref:Biotin-dependent enzyme n=1 Tax=Kitasatospora atroaurantiaca TaxID=285545 RepID=A0A561EXX9_9ACTN|nr:acetyl-CoA carboxylase biotin carboxyl carrier protein subunit [Kitasatospora atroaurantiaca]TWE20470.1 biotin-dependent enzyme [Kitasatospora atroaurantiaca]
MTTTTATKQRTALAAAQAAAVLEPGLDRPVGLIGARLWAAAAALLLAVGAGTAWATLGSLPHTVTLDAVIAHGPAPAVARADVAGSVLDVRAQPGERVTEGQVLAVLRTPTGERTELRAPVAGTVTAVLAPPGSAVAAGGPVVTLDSAAAPATVRLYAASEREAARLRPGREVLVPLPGGGVVRAVITAVDPLPVRARSLDGTLPVPLPGLPGGDAPVWAAYAQLPTPVAGGPVPVRVAVDLGARHPYQAVFGTGEQR